MTPRTHVRLTHDPLSTDQAQAFVADPGAGAVVCFSGTVRNHAEGRDVTGLTYEAYEDHATRQMTALAEEVAQRWPGVQAIWLEHRVGALAVSETAVVVAVSAGHREEAFEAGRYAIDTLKATVAIWKKEHWADGESHWPGVPERAAGNESGESHWPGVPERADQQERGTS